MYCILHRLVHVKTKLKQKLNKLLLMFKTYYIALKLYSTYMYYMSRVYITV